MPSSSPGFALLFGAAGGVIGATGFYAMPQSIAARLAPGREAAPIARLTIWGALSSPLFIPGTGLANGWSGWRTTLRIDVVLVAVAFAVASAVVDRTGATSSPRPSVSPVLAVRLAFQSPAIRRLSAFACAATGGMAILLVYQVPLLVAAGVSATTASALGGARGFAQLLGRPPLTRIIGRFGVRPCLRSARAALALGCLVVVVSGHTALAILYIVLAGASIGAMSSLDGIYARQSLPPDDLGTLMGAVALLTGAAGAIGPVLAAVLVDAIGRRSTAAFHGGLFHRCLASESMSCLRAGQPLGCPMRRLLPLGSRTENSLIPHGRTSTGESGWPVAQRRACQASTSVTVT